MPGNGAVAVHAAMTKTGHQAQRNTTNPESNDEDRDVVTAFHPDSEQVATMLYGTNFVEIQPSTAGGDFRQSQTFTFSNDVDAIGDVYCRIAYTSPDSNPPSTVVKSITPPWQTTSGADATAEANALNDLKDNFMNALKGITYQIGGVPDLNIPATDVDVSTVSGWEFWSQDVEVKFSAAIAEKEANNDAGAIDLKVKLETFRAWSSGVKQLIEALTGPARNLLGASGSLGNPLGATKYDTREVIQSPGLISVLDRIEVMVGNSTWQTLENSDLLSLLRHSEDFGAASALNMQSMGGFRSKGEVSHGFLDHSTKHGSFSVGPLNETQFLYPDEQVHLWLPLKIFTCGGPARAHLTAGAPHQTFRIKLTYAEKHKIISQVPIIKDNLDNYLATTSVDARSIKLNSNTRAELSEIYSGLYSVLANGSGLLTAAFAAGVLPGTVDTSKFSLPASATMSTITNVPSKLDVNTYLRQLTDVSSMPSTSAGSLDVQLWARQHVMTNYEREEIRRNVISKTLYLSQHQSKALSSSDMDVECDSFSLLASHLIINVERQAGGGLVDGRMPDLSSAELLLNTSSHSGVLDGAFMISQAAASMDLPVYLPHPTVTSTVKSHLISNINDNQYMHGDGANKTGLFYGNTYVFPIATRPYGPDGCPLNRFDTIRLKLKFVGVGAPGAYRVNVTCVGTASAIYSRQAAALQYHS